MAFEELLPGWTNSPKSQSRWPSSTTSFSKALQNSFSLSSWLLVGACLQTIILAIIPRFFAAIPIFVILAGRVAYNLLITYDILPNPYLKDAILHLHAAQVPDRDGNFNDGTAGAEGVAILHLGAKFNHPLGIFAPNVKQFGGYLNEMITVLDSDKTTHGYLGGSNFTSFDERGATETSFISYWRSIEDIHEFAYGPSHRRAWEWWNKMTPKEIRHIGINHEIFYSAPGQWETLYANFQPTLLGATTYLRKGDKMIGGTVEDKWVSGLLDASRGKLRSSAGRLGWQPEALYKKYDVAASTNGAYEQ